MQDTSWIKEMKNKYAADISKFFIITGNIGDYTPRGVLLMDYLKEKLRTDFKFDSVQTLNISAINFDNNDRIWNITKAAELLVFDEHPERNEKRAIIVKYPEYLFPSSPQANNAPEGLITMFEAINSREFITSDNMLIFITESRYSINEKFLGASCRSSLIEIKFPDERERLDYIQYLHEGARNDFKKEITVEEFARLSAGLTLIGIEDIFLQSLMSNHLKRNSIMDRKKELINTEYGDVIEVMDSDGYNFNDFSGQEQLKKYHLETIIKPMKSGRYEVVPKGLLYTGPPGTGKTHFARCLAGEAGINFVELKMSKLKDMWVGNSEKKFDKALTCIRSIAPCGVFIDEIDQSFSRGGSDSGVSGALFGMFLTILSEPQNRGKILWIGATNYPNLLDEALKRTGRLDKKMPFLPPDEDDRKKVLNLYLDKSKRENQVTEGCLNQIAIKTDGYTQAELEGITVKTIELVERRDSRIIKDTDLEFAFDCIKKTASVKIKEMIDLAIEECNDLEFLPPKYRKEGRR